MLDYQWSPDEVFHALADPSADGPDPADRRTVSLTTVEFQAVAEGTRLLLTEQDAFLDGQEEPGWREEGTRQWLAGLATELGEGSRS